MKKYVFVRKIEKVVVISGSRRLQKTAAGLTARHCDVGLTSTWFEAALLDVSVSPDLPDISMNVTECHCGFLLLHCQRCGASIYLCGVCV